MATANTFNGMLPNYKQVYSDSAAKKKIKEEALKKLSNYKKKPV